MSGGLWRVERSGYSNYTFLCFFFYIFFLTINGVMLCITIKKR